MRNKIDLKLKTISNYVNPTLIRGISTEIFSTKRSYCSNIDIGFFWQFMLSLNFFPNYSLKKLNCLVALTVPRVDLPSAMTAATAVAVSTQYTEIRFEKLCPLTTYLTTSSEKLVLSLNHYIFVHSEPDIIQMSA